MCQLCLHCMPFPLKNLVAHFEWHFCAMYGSCTKYNHMLAYVWAWSPTSLYSFHTVTIMVIHDSWTSGHYKAFQIAVPLLFFFPFLCLFFLFGLQFCCYCSIFCSFYCSFALLQILVCSLCCSFCFFFCVPFYMFIIVYVINLYHLCFIYIVSISTIVCIALCLTLILVMAFGWYSNYN